VHCTRHHEELTWDHVFPRAWYPDTTPVNVEKWKMPACRKCNREHGELEEDLLLRLGMCVPRADSKAAGISEKALRSIQPEAARNERDRAARAARRAAVLREVERLPAAPAYGLLPGFGRHRAAPDGPVRTVHIHPDQLMKLGTKLVRGITYVTRQAFIDDAHYAIEIFVAREGDQQVAEIDAMIRRLGATDDRGPGISITHAHAADDREQGLFLIEVWGRLRLHGSVSRRDL
jgi:hypothetical protein